MAIGKNHYRRHPKHYQKAKNLSPIEELDWVDLERLKKQQEADEDICQWYEDWLERQNNFDHDNRIDDWDYPDIDDFDNEYPFYNPDPWNY